MIWANTSWNMSRLGQNFMVDLVHMQETDGILVITINRPEARNAINYPTALALSKAFEQLDADPALRLGILTGAGGTFSSGMDLKDFAQSGIRPRVGNKGLAGLNEAPPTKPLIAAVEGFAVAGGFEMVLACDLVVSAKNARFGLPEVKRGLVAASGGLLRLPRRMPYHIAMELILTGDHLEAERAYQYGLINVLTEPGQALSQAMALAQRIGENGPLAVQASKRIVIEGLDWEQRDMFAKQAPMTKHIFESEDAREGALAFAQKRKPVWQSK